MFSKHMKITTVVAMAFCLLRMLFVVLPAASKAPSEGPSNNVSFGGGEYLEGSNSPDQVVNSLFPLVGTFVTTKTVEIANPNGTYRYLFEAAVTGMPAGTYTWHVGVFPDSLSDLVFDWIGGSGCSLQPDQNIVCGSGITSFYVSYRVTDIYDPISKVVNFGAGGYTEGYLSDHIATLRYIEPMEFISSIHYATNTPITPIVNSNHTLTWQISNVSDGLILSKIYDPRIQLVYLPAVNK